MASFRGDEIFGFVELILRTSDKGDSCTGRGEALRDRAPNAPTAAGDQGDLTGQVDGSGCHADSCYFADVLPNTRLTVAV
jgi:hypothetical protein